MITPGLIEETVAHTCDASTSMLSKRVEFDLSDLDPGDIPTEMKRKSGHPASSSWLLYKQLWEGCRSTLQSGALSSPCLCVSV